jgi:hypothetical protein
VPARAGVAAAGAGAAKSLAPQSASVMPGAASMPPPTLSWPPIDYGPPVGARVRRAPSPAPAALMPPRGEDPSLAPLPRLPDVPDFRRSGKPRLGGREIGLLLLFVLLGVLGALVAWESAPSATIEVLSEPTGARVRINGAWQPGTTPLRVSGLRRGTRYRLRVALPRYRAYETLFEAGYGPARRTITLVPE